MTEWISPDAALQMAYGNNPLLEAIGPHLDNTTLGQRMAQRPLECIPWQRVRPAERQAFLPHIENHYVPTPITLEVAQCFQGLLRQHYIRRNPLSQRTRSQLDTMAMQHGATIQSLPWFNSGAGAMALRGITGMGKSVTQDRVLSLFPQTVLHGPSAAAGWLQMRQLVYLRVQMSSDNSRAGFLTQILAQVDNALGTDYHEQYANKPRWTVEKLMVVVGIILSRHYCGALIIEELQERNFAEGGSRELLLLFFLRLLNFGIPIVLLGNPRGFHAFDEFTQDVRRLYSAGCFDFWPSDTVDDADWNDFYLPGLSEFHLLNKPFIWTPEARVAAIRGSGGVPAFMTTLWAACQRNALQTGSDEIHPTHVDMAAADAALAPQRALIAALRDQNVHALALCRDVPYEDFHRRWRPQKPAGTAAPQADPPVSAAADVSTVVPAFAAAERRYKAATTRAATKAAKPKVSRAKDDLRNEFTRAALQDGLAALRTTTEQAAASTAGAVPADVAAP